MTHISSVLTSIWRLAHKCKNLESANHKNNIKSRPFAKPAMRMRQEFYSLRAREVATRWTTELSASNVWS